MIQQQLSLFNLPDDAYAATQSSINPEFVDAAEGKRPRPRIAIIWRMQGVTYGYCVWVGKDTDFCPLNSQGFPALSGYELITQQSMVTTFNVQDRLCRKYGISRQHIRPTGAFYDVYHERWYAGIPE